MSHPQDLRVVLENDLCIGCGACVAASPGLSLKLDPKKLMYEPDGVGDERAAAVCPSIRVDYERLHGALFPDAEPGHLGVVRSVWLAQSVDRERNLKASSGGLIKELLIELLSRPDVDGAIALTHKEGLLYEPTLLRKPEEVDSLPGSIYHSLPFEKALTLLRENEGRFVLVAIPCQLEGLYQHILAHEPELLDRIYTTIGLICGWQYTHHSLKAIGEFTNTPYEKLRNVSYRGGGPVGRLRLFTDEGEKRVHRRVSFSYQVAFDRSFNIPRCHMCINHTNFLAEIVVGDAWLPSTVMTKTGISLVLCRSERAEEVMGALETAGRVRRTQVTEDEVVESQTRRVAFGDFAYAYSDYLRARGRHVPDMEGPNRPAAKLVPVDEVMRFDVANRKKRALQQRGRYRELLVRKATVEFGPYASRYLRWFSVRVLKVKSLLGQRKEVPKEKLAGFE